MAVALIVIPYLFLHICMISVLVFDKGRKHRRFWINLSNFLLMIDLLLGFMGNNSGSGWVILPLSLSFIFKLALIEHHGP